MELTKNFYRLIFNNGQEFFINDEEPDEDKFISKLDKSGIFSGNSGKIKVKLRGEGETLFLSSKEIFSAQKSNSEMVGSQTKIWKLVD